MEATKVRVGRKEDYMAKKVYWHWDRPKQVDGEWPVVGGVFQLDVYENDLTQLFVHVPKEEFTRLTEDWKKEIEKRVWAEVDAERHKKTPAGAKVRLKTGGPVMVVQQAPCSETHWLAVCAWFFGPDDDLRKGSFAPEALDTVTE